MSLEIDQVQLNSLGFDRQSSLVIPDGVDSLWINNVFTVNRERVFPARFLSGFLPSFQLADLIQDASSGQITPTVRVFIPAYFTSFINDIDPNTQTDLVNQGQEVLQTLQSNFFPQIPVLFDQDQPVNESHLEKLDKVIDLILLHCKGKDLDDIRKNGQKRGGATGEKQALLYASHHPVGWSDIHDPTFFTPLPPGFVINTLPPREKPYTNIRQRIREELSRRQNLKHLIYPGERVNLELSLCKTAHYIPIKDGEAVVEPTLDDLSTKSAHDILSSLKDTIDVEQNTGRRGTLEGSMKDLRRLLVFLSDGQSADMQGFSFRELLEGKVAV